MESTRVKTSRDGYKRRASLFERSAPYTPEQNGAAERLNRVLIEKVRAMLLDSGLPMKYWAEAVVAANFQRNRTPIQSLGKTPYEVFYGKKPDVSNMRVFGCAAYVQVPKDKRSKLQPMAEKGVFIGYQIGVQGLQSP